MDIMYVIIFAILVIFLFVSFACIDNKIDNITYRINELEKEIEKYKDDEAQK